MSHLGHRFIAMLSSDRFWGCGWLAAPIMSTVVHNDAGATQGRSIGIASRQAGSLYLLFVVCRARVRRSDPRPKPDSALRLTGQTARPSAGDLLRLRHEHAKDTVEFVPAHTTDNAEVLDYVAPGI